MPYPFAPSQFTPTEWNTAQDKADFANHFVRFVRSGYSRALFTRKFYERLRNTFGHYAHYNQAGFWEDYFANPEGVAEFARITEQHRIYGDPHYTFSDAERALQEWAQLDGMYASALRVLSNDTTAQVLPDPGEAPAIDEDIPPDDEWDSAEEDEDFEEWDEIPPMLE